MKTSRVLSCRPLSQRDSHSIFLHAHNDVSCHTQPLLSTDPKSEAIIRRWIRRHEYEQSSYHLTITLDDEVAGVAGLCKIRSSRDAEVFYWIAASYRGLGLTKPILGHLEEKAREKYSLSCLYTYIDQQNKISAKIVQDQGYGLVIGSSDTFFDQDLYVKRLDKNNTPPYLQIPLAIDTSYKKHSPLTDLIRK